MSRWVGGDGGAAEISAVDQVTFSGSGYTSHAFSGVNYGALGGRRALTLLIVAPGGVKPSSVDIDGIAATQITSVLFSGITNWIAPVPSGTSGTITLSWGSSQSEGVSMMVFRLVRWRSLTPTADSGILAASGSANLSASITIKSKGSLLCFSGDPNATGRTTTWSSPVTETNDYSPNLSSAKSASAAIFNNSGADTTPTITATPSASGANRFGRYLAWR